MTKYFTLNNAVGKEMCMMEREHFSTNKGHLTEQFVTTLKVKNYRTHYEISLF